MNHSPECWPREPHQSCIDNEESSLVELKKTSPNIVYSMSNSFTNCDRQTSSVGKIIDMNRYSTKLKLLLVKAAIRRCAEKWKIPHHKFESTELTAQELQEAERILIWNIQEHEFQCELQCLAGGSKILTPRCLTTGSRSIQRCTNTMRGKTSEIFSSTGNETTNNLTRKAILYQTSYP